MRWLIWYIRSWFCKHDWEREERRFISDGEFRHKEGVRVSATCKKCIWHRSYWKY